MRELKYLFYCIVTCFIIGASLLYFNYLEKQNRELYENRELWVKNQVSEIKSRPMQNNGCINVYGSDSLKAVVKILHQGYCIGYEN